MRIVVTGTTGKIGGEVARRLASAPGIELRMVGRRVERAPQLEGVETVPAGFDDAAACHEAFRGVDALLLVSAGEAADRLGRHLHGDRRRRAGSGQRPRAGGAGPGAGGDRGGGRRAPSAVVAALRTC